MIMTTKQELITIIRLCKEALESCGDNYGSESADNGNFEMFYNTKKVEKALKEISKANKASK